MKEFKLLPPSVLPHVNLPSQTGLLNRFASKAASWRPATDGAGQNLENFLCATSWLEFVLPEVRHVPDGATHGASSSDPPLSSQTRTSQGGTSPTPRLLKHTSAVLRSPCLRTRHNHGAARHESVAANPASRRAERRAEVDRAPSRLSCERSALAREHARGRGYRNDRCSERPNPSLVRSGRRWLSPSVKVRRLGRNRRAFGPRSAWMLRFLEAP